MFVWPLGVSVPGARVLADDTEADSAAGSQAREQAIAAAVARGEALWQKSCKRADSALGCWSVERVDAPTYCGDGYTRVTWQRKRKTHDQAMGHFNQAIHLASRAPADEQASARRAAATAYLRRAQSDLEQAMVMRFPTDLVFSDDQPKLRRLSTERFTKWLRKSQNDVQKVQKQLSELMHEGGAGLSPAERVRIYASVAGLLERYADVIEHAWIPKNVRTGEQASELRRVYCETIGDQAESIRQQAESTYQVCAGLAEQLSVSTPIAAQCTANASAAAPTP